MRQIADALRAEGSTRKARQESVGASFTEFPRDMQRQVMQDCRFAIEELVAVEHIMAER